MYASWRNSGALIDGQYWSWGYNGLGNVGNGTTTQQLTPEQISLPAPVTSVGLGGSGDFNGQTLVLLTDGTMWGWGSDQWGQLGDGGSATAVPAPIKVATPVTFTVVKSGGQSSYALDAAGNLWGWGDNSRHQMGNGTTTPQPTPGVIASDVSGFSTTSSSEEALTP